MKIRIGFVTNSSSTNFLIISKEELSSEYLLSKLGFNSDSKIINIGRSLVKNIMYGIGDLQWHEYDEVNYDVISEAFGEESAARYLELNKRGFHTYIGSTESAGDYLTIFMTTDSFLIDEDDFYMNGLNCTW
jgi:hypothetical protein